MLVEPPEDPARLAQDRALAGAVRARLAGGGRSTPDADAIALRTVLKGLTPAEAAAVRSVLGRVDAAHGAPLIVWGPASQVLAADRFGLVARVAAKPEAALAAAREGGRALMDLTLDGFAIGNGVLTVENEEQAIARADPKQGDKGGHAARAALSLFELREKYGP